MRYASWSCVGVFLCCWLSAVIASAAENAAKPARKSFGLEKRIPWATSRIHGSPDPASPYQTENAFPKLKFYEPLSLSALPGTNRLLVAERPGKIFSFVNESQTEEKALLVDVGRTVYAATVHPRFAENGYIFVMSVLDAMNPSPDGSRVSRFKVTGRNPPRADAKSEEVILTWPSGGHNGGCLQFGPDGFLYLATGDGSGIADQLETGQKLDDLLAAILRIDVDQPTAGKM